MGGGFSNGGGELTVSKSTISDNTAEHGGGIANVSGTLTVSNSTIASNSAPANAGGIDNSTPVTLTVINSIVSGNSSGGAGGISNLGTLVVNNSTITDNSAQAGGPTPFPAGILAVGTETLHSTIVAGNHEDRRDILGSIDTAEYNLIGDAASSGGIVDGSNGNIVGNSGMGTIDINTVLDTNLAFNGGPTKTHAMVCGGLAIDNGKNFSGLTTDQRGPGFARTMPPSLRWAFVTGAYSRMSFAS